MQEKCMSAFWHFRTQITDDMMGQGMIKMSEKLQCCVQSKQAMSHTMILSCQELWIFWHSLFLFIKHKFCPNLRHFILLKLLALIIKQNNRIALTVWSHYLIPRTATEDAQERFY